MKKIILTLLSSLLLVGTVNAAAPSFTNLTSADLDNVTKEMSADFTYTSASAPSNATNMVLPWLGFEVGAIAGIAKTPKIQALVTTSKIDYLPHAGGFLALRFPYGISAESIFFPKTTVSGVSLTYTSFAAKWLVTDMFFQSLPIKIAVKGNYSLTTFKYGQVLNNSTTGNTNVNIDVKVEDKIWGFNTAASYELWNFFEPYVGLGIASANGSVNIAAASAAYTFFTGQGLQGQTASSKPSSFLYFGGTQFNLSVFRLGLEAMRAFGTNNFTSKVSFAF